MGNFIVIFGCLLAGLTLKRFKAFPPSTAQALNSFIIYLSLPAVILSQIPPLISSLKMDNAVLIPISMAWLNFALAFTLFLALGRLFKWSHPKTGALILTAGLGNTSFVGLPLLEALIGPEALPLGLLVDQPGSFLVLSTLGLVVASVFSGSAVTSKFILKRILSFPPFIALVASIIWSFCGQQGYLFLAPVFGKIAATLVPLALFAVGFQLNLDPKVLRKRWTPLALGLGFKLILAPLLFAFLYLKIWKGQDLTVHVTILESAMAPMITSAVVANDFKLDGEIANLMVGVGIPLSLLTVPLINYLIF